MIAQQPGEQNFHIFYLFFGGISAEQKAQFQVSDPSQHRVINSNEEALAYIRTKECKAMYVAETVSNGLLRWHLHRRTHTHAHIHTHAHTRTVLTLGTVSSDASPSRSPTYRQV